MKYPVGTSDKPSTKRAIFFHNESLALFSDVARNTAVQFSLSHISLDISTAKPVTL